MNTDYISKPIRSDFFIVSRNGRLSLQVSKESVFRRSRPFVCLKHIKMNYHDYIIEVPIEPFWIVIYFLFLLFIMLLGHEDDK